MRKATGLLCVLIVTLFFMSGCNRSRDNDTANSNPFVKQNIASDQFSPAAQCQYCHLDIYQQWLGSAHAGSAVDPAYVAEVVRASKATEGASDPFCSRCHSPVGWLADEVPPAGGDNLSQVARQGISCDLCHTITSIEGVGNAQFYVTPGNVKFGPFDDPLETPLHESAYNRIYTQSEYCSVCHEIIHPQNGLVLSSVYTEWKESSYGSRRVTCQDCHMTPGSGITKPNPGYSVSGAPKRRDHISTHYMSARSTEDNLKGVAYLQLGAPESLPPFQPARVSVRIRNDGAGHYLPGGLTLVKEMWLEVIVTDGNGRTLFTSGVIDSQGRIPDGTVTFGRTFADTSGEEAKHLWDAASVLHDNRIPPQQYVDEYVEIPGLSFPGELDIQVRLLYRKNSTSPVFELANEQQKIIVR